jgi:hypothetical protein
MNLRLSRPAGALVLCLAVALAALTAWAAPDRPVPPVTRTIARKPVPKPLRDEQVGRVMTASTDRHFDGNSINMFVTNQGSFAYDLGRSVSGLYFPNHTNKTVVYASGIWLGANLTDLGGEKRVAIGEYSQEFDAGAMVGGTFDDSSKPEYTVYKVVRYTGDPAETTHVERTAAELAADRTVDAIVHHSWSEYVNGAKPYGAPTRMYRMPGATNPSDSVDVEGPDVLGDQMLWAVYNDANPAKHTNNAGSSQPLGVEIQQSTFGFDRQGPLGNTVYLKFVIINKGGHQLDSAYVSLWSDPDLGGAGDDLVGSDVPKSMGYVYNATNNDQTYADRPPAVGYDFFKGPTIAREGLPDSTLGLASFDFYINGKDPKNATQTLFLMQGLNADGTPVIDPVTDEASAYYASGDPVAGTGWLDSNPADRRFLMSAGPFSMAPGDTQIVVGAIVVAQGADRLTSITALKFFDNRAQKAFDLDFNLPSPPPQPKVAYSTSHGTVNLLWDSNPRFNYAAWPGYAFEGYVVYQGASVSGPWKRLRVFDLVNGITDVRDTVFDVNTGMIINDTPTAFGGDNGVQYTFSTTQDAVRGGPLRDGQTYYYAVTAYAVNLNPAKDLEKVLETSFKAVPIVVQRPPSGTDFAAAYVNGATDHRADTELPPTTDHVIVDVVDPSQITGHEYAITYQGSPGARKSTLVSTTPWSLVDLTTGQTLLSNQTERSNTPSYSPINGMVVKLLEQQAAEGPLNDIYYTPFRASTPFKGVGAGLGTFEDSFGYAFDFFAGVDYTDPANADSFPNVELRFGQTQKAYMYFRDELADGTAPAHGRGYWYGGLGDVPFTAWDTDHNMQLEVGFLERRTVDNAGNPTGGPSMHDNMWMPTTDASGAGREYLAISGYPYTGVAKAPLNDNPAFQNDGGWRYAAWLYRTGAPILAGDKFVIVASPTGNDVGTPNDTLRFTTSGPLRNQVALQKAGLERIRAVPNPYYGKSAYELSALNRVVKFVNMPETATVRIYNLAGDLIRTLQKTDQASSVLEWNLLTENQLPVASGVYVYHIAVPGAGQTTGKMVVFTEKERLSTL